MLEFKVITNTKQLNVTNLQEFEDYLNSELGKRISPVRVVTFLFPWSNVIGVVSLVKLDLKEGRCISRKQLESRFRDYLGKLKVNEQQEEGMISRWVKNEKYFVMIGQWPWDSLLREFEEIGDLEYKQDGLVVVELRGFDG